MCPGTSPSTRTAFGCRGGTSGASRPRCGARHHTLPGLGARDRGYRAQGEHGRQRVPQEGRRRPSSRAARRASTPSCTTPRLSSPSKRRGEREREKESEFSGDAGRVRERRSFQLLITPRVSRFPLLFPRSDGPRRSSHGTVVFVGAKFPQGVAWDRTPGTRRARPRRTRGTRKATATGWDTPPNCRPPCPGMGKGGGGGRDVRGGSGGTMLTWRGGYTVGDDGEGGWGSSVAHPVGAFLGERVVVVKDVVADVDDSLLERRQGVGPVVPAVPGGRVG